MANELLQSSAVKQTTAPDYYTKYLSNLATSGQKAGETARFIGATPLQQQAFQTAGANAGKFQPAFQSGLGVLGCAAAKDISGAAAPYLTEAMQMNPGQVAQNYMSPYLTGAMQNMSDIANRNIMTNLGPMATAGTVGSGQFGSKRGAEVLGQVKANALQDLNRQLGCMTNQGFGSALQAATARGSLLGQLGQTAGAAASQCAQAKTQAGLGYGTLGQQGTQQNIACIDALANLGAQCQTIQQNAECFAMSQLGKQAGLLQGAQIPTGVKTTMNMSPLSGAAAIGTGAMALCRGGYLDKIKSALCFGAPSQDQCQSVYANCATDEYGRTALSYAKKGGSIRSKKRVGCSSLRQHGGLPRN